MSVNVDKSRGFVVLYRTIEEHLLWTQHPPAYLKVWIYCLLKATYKPRKYWDGHKEVELPIGGFVSGSIEMAKKCNISRGQVRRALEVFESSQMLTSKPTNKFTVYVVVNFERYQNENLPTGQQTTNKLPSNDHQPATNNKETTTESIQKEKIAPPARKRDILFDEFWKIVWLKRGKDNAKTAWLKKVRSEEDCHRIIAAAKAQGPQLLAEAAASNRTPIYPATWLNGGHYDNEDLLPFDATPTTTPEEQAEKARRLLASKPTKERLQ